MSPDALRQEIIELIIFYEDRGWDWLDAVAFTIAKAQYEAHRQILHRD